MNNQINAVEWAPFQLNDGVSESDLINAAEKIQSEFLASQPGYVKRELLKASGEVWVDLIHWTDKESAFRQEALARPLGFS